MTNALDLSYYNDATDLTKIDSHTSQLTNLRLHNLEMQVDHWRMNVRRDASQDNIIGYYSALNALFGYLLSLKNRRENKELRDKIKDIQDNMDALQGYWCFIMKRIENQQIKEIKKKHPKTFWNIIENDMIQLCEATTNEIRLLYQTLQFYFRTSKVSAVTGIAGDLAALKNKKGESIAIKDEGESNKDA